MNFFIKLFSYVYKCLKIHQHYQGNKEKIQKSLSKEEKEKKRQYVVNNTNISQKMKNKRWLSIEKIS